MRTTVALLALASLVHIAAAQQQAPKAPQQALPTVVQPEQLGLTSEEALALQNYQLKKQVLDSRVNEAEKSLLTEYVAKATEILAKHHLTNIIIDKQSFNLLRAPEAKQPAAPAAATPAKPPAK